MKKVMRVEVGGNVVVDEMDGLKEYQEFVGGYIEIPYISEKLHSKKIDIIINEEGKLLELEPSFAVMNNGKIVDIICGNVIFASHDINGKTRSLSMKQVEYLMENVLQKRVLATKKNGEVLDLGIIEF